MLHMHTFTHACMLGSGVARPLNWTAHKAVLIKGLVTLRYINCAYSGRANQIVSFLKIT